MLHPLLELLDRLIVLLQCAGVVLIRRRRHIRMQNFQARARLLIGWCSVVRIATEGDHELRMFVQRGDGQKTVRHQRLGLRELQNVALPEVLSQRSGKPLQRTREKIVVRAFIAVTELQRHGRAMLERRT